MLKKAHRLQIVSVILGTILVVLSLLLIGPTKDIAPFKDIRTRQIPFNADRYCRNSPIAGECNVSGRNILPERVNSAVSFLITASRSGEERILLYYPIDALTVGLALIAAGLGSLYLKRSN